MRTMFSPVMMLGLALSNPALSHEFWISPGRYVVPVGEAITAELRVGENLKGAAYAYIDFRAERFEYVTSSGTEPVPARMGDRPALNMAAPGEGLMVIVHQTSDSTLTYKEWAKFQKFVAHKDFRGALDTHKARGLPESGFVESYRRHAKSLIAVGNGTGQDAPVGMETEIIAVTNPYTDDIAGGMAIDVLYEGKPRPNVQVELFEKAPDGAVVVTLHRTDDDGRAVLPVKPGHEYLADAVVLRSTGNDDPKAGPVWHTLWASLTFAVPS
ncbi:DUF4198 domain-containing protein [Actibacterium sp. 188UL27-1]|uniref:DUF4198 domain-containing protein n=1 Tax=Actibacterium sp. 188UL27-1 TaxID=2786961 RepID=UPI00195DA965|nr:DUF4198 domain-containing protein [Actibacterium sp. 188UL27-1]MBM7070390.1 DUF4198 domain-containing protein [Actibacterium sp. 188UL27-1]